MRQCGAFVRKIATLYGQQQCCPAATYHLEMLVQQSVSAGKVDEVGNFPSVILQLAVDLNCSQVVLYGSLRAAQGNASGSPMRQRLPHPATVFGYFEYGYRVIQILNSLPFVLKGHIGNAKSHPVYSLVPSVANLLVNG
jgi:hypothetical protein